MASMERFETLLGKADAAAGQALEMIPNTNGSERGKLYAGIAAMWLEAARLEHEIVAVETLTRRVERLVGRVRDLERRAGYEADDDIPDVFAEPSEADDERDEMLRGI